MNCKFVDLLFAAVTTVAVSACTLTQIEDIGYVEEDGLVTVTATAEPYGGDVRTSLQPDGSTIYWNPGDEIKLFAEEESAKFTSVNTVSGMTAKFKGMLSFAFGSNEGGDGSTYLWGLNPYQEDASFDGSAITATVPTVQEGVPGSFGKGTFLSIAKSDSWNLTYYNLCGGLKFNLKHAGINKVILKSNGGETLSGKVKIGVDGSKHPYVTEVVNGVDSLVLVPAEGDAFIPGQNYYFSCLPVTMSSGLTLKFIGDCATAQLVSTKSNTIKRSVFGNVGTVDKNLVYTPVLVDLGLNVKWGACNLGASSAEEYGGYYAWGELETKSEYRWTTYKYSLDTEGTSFSKYTGEDYTVLESSDDIAHETFGDKWRIPTQKDFEDLKNPDNCTWTWTQVNGVNGYRVTSKKDGFVGNSIFLPAAGLFPGQSLYKGGISGFYWSSSLYSGDQQCAFDLNFDSESYVSPGNGKRCYGRTVRPVQVKTEKITIIIGFDDLS